MIRSWYDVINSASLSASDWITPGQNRSMSHPDLIWIGAGYNGTVGWIIMASGSGMDQTRIYRDPAQIRRDR